MRARNLGFGAAAATLSTVVLASDPSTPGSAPTNWLVEWRGTKTGFPYWELGQEVMDSFGRYPGCFPVEVPDPKHPDLSRPCSGLRYFYPNCTYGLSLEAVLDKHNTFMLNPFQDLDWQQRTNASQQDCYCQGDYWEYVRGCNACMQEHGYPQQADWNDNMANWIPPTYVDQQSSTYCGAAGAATGVLDFLYSFTPTGDISSKPSAAIASTAIAVSDYFTITNTLAAPTQATQIGDLQSTTTVVTVPTSSSRAEPTRVLSPVIVGGAGLAVAILGSL